MRALLPLQLLGLIVVPCLAQEPITPDHRDVASCRAAIAELELRNQDPPPDTLRLLSWNIMKYRRAGSYDVVKRLARNADFVALQEGVLATVIDAPDLTYRYFANGYASAERQTGVEVLSRLPATVSCALRFQEPWLRTPKAALAAHYALGSEGLLLITLHAINFTFWVTDLERQFAAVGELIDAHGGPAIVIGDFNNWNAYRQTVIESFAQRHGLEIARFEPDDRSRHLGVPVDGVLQRGFKILSASAVRTDTSDHHPILVRLRLRESSATAVDRRAEGAAPGPAP